MSATKMYPMDGLCFQRYKVHADIRGGSVARGPQTTVGWPERAIFFCNFGRDIFGAVRVEANFIMQRHEVPCRFSTDFKMPDLECP